MTFAPDMRETFCCLPECNQWSKSALRLTESVGSECVFVPQAFPILLMTPHFCLDCCHFNTMLLRTVVLLLLCLSTGMGATLGYYQTDVKEEGDPAAESVFATQAASVDVAKEGVAAAHVGDSAPVEANTGNSIFGDKPLLEIGLRESQAGSKLGKAVQLAAAGATGKEAGPDSDGPPGDTAGMKEAKSPEQPDSDVNEITPVQTNESQKGSPEEEDTSWSLNSIRNRFQTVHGYFDSLVELVGGRNGVCEYRCRRNGKN